MTKFQAAVQLKGQKVPPVWFMRQAGRYHKHYQKLKEKYDFITLCKEPELAAEVAMGPIQDFDFDAAILFSDLLFPLEALGMGLTYAPGPILDRQLTLSDLKKVRPLNEALGFLEFQKEAMRLTRERLPKDKGLIGFVGGTFTLFTYAVSGGHDGNLIAAKTQLDFYKQFGEIMVPLLEKNIQLQLDGGAELVMIFDTAAGEVSPPIFQAYLAPQLAQLAAKFPKKLGYYSKGTHRSHLTNTVFADQNWAGYGVDHKWNLPGLMKDFSNSFIQGNFDQALLFSEPADFTKRLNEYLKPFIEMPESTRKGWVCGLGHGVLPKTPEDNVRRFVATVREVFSK
jgi:uroporphyrinogen decarboxylase